MNGVSGIGLTVLLAALASVASRTGVQTASEAGGTHIRVETAHGPVHLFRPAGYDRRTAGLVIYVHGLYTGVDQAWREHGLAAQFAASGANALFVAPEAPAAADQPPPWSDLESLIVTALGRARLRRPSGPLVAVGHSGAYRTLAAWLDDPALRHLILIDALYGEEGAFRAWLDRDRGHKMTLVVKGTARWADPFVRAFPRALTVRAHPGVVRRVLARPANRAVALPALPVRTHGADHRGAHAADRPAPDRARSHRQPGSPSCRRDTRTAGAAVADRARLRREGQCRSAKRPRTSGLGRPGVRSPKSEVRSPRS